MKKQTMKSRLFLRNGNAYIFTAVLSKMPTKCVCVKGTNQAAIFTFTFDHANPLTENILDELHYWSPLVSS